jgi:hypothetical protein
MLVQLPTIVKQVRAVGFLDIASTFPAQALACARPTSVGKYGGGNGLHSFAIERQ